MNIDEISETIKYNRKQASEMTSNINQDYSKTTEGKQTINNEGYETLNNIPVEYKLIIGANSDQLTILHMFFLFLAPILGIIYFFTNWISNEVIILFLLLNPLYFIAFFDTVNQVTLKEQINSLKLYEIRDEYLNELFLIKKEIEELREKKKDIENE